MAGSNLARREPESVGDFMERRRRELAHLGSEASAKAHELYGKAIRAGRDLDLPTAGEVMAYGADLLQGASRRTAARPAPPAKRPLSRPAIARNPRGAGHAASAPRAAPSGGRTSSLDRNPYAKAAGGYVAMVAGNAAGVNRGAVHMAEDALGAVAFLNRLADPLDQFRGPPGTSAGAQLADAGKALIDYGASVWANPHRVVDDVRSGANKVYADLVPSAMPAADTFAGEVGRMYGIGKNQGELALNVALLPAGGEALGPLATLRGASRLKNATRYLEEAGHADAAAYLAKPYEGKGHHVYFPREADLPKILGGGKVPRFIVDSPFNVLQFKGLTQGEGYALHASVDKFANSFRMPDKFGVRSWRAKKAGIDTQAGFDRIWNGTPEAVKSAAGSFVGGAGGLVHEAFDEDEAW